MKITLDNGEERTFDKNSTIAELKEFLDKNKEGTEQKGPWVPKPGEKYWNIDSLGYISETTIDSKRNYHYRIQRGNCFQTETDARRYRDIDTIIHRIVWEKNREEAIDWKAHNICKWYLYFDHRDKDTRESKTTCLPNHKTPYCSQPFLVDVLKEISQADLSWYMARG